MRQSSIPDLELSLGQMLWAVALGSEPSEQSRNRARYLRLLGIPRQGSEKGPGSGKRIVYDFDDLVLVGLGMLALSHGQPPRTMKEVLVVQRSRLLRDVHQAWLDLPADVLDDPVTISRGKSFIVYDNDFNVNLSGTGWGKASGLDFIKIGNNPLHPVHIIPGETPQVVFSLKQWMPQWVAWALRAPKRQRGRKS